MRSSGLRSVRTPRYAGWRSLPSRVISRTLASTTTSGRTHTAPRASMAGTGSQNGESGTRSGSSSSISWRCAAPAIPLPILPAYRQPSAVGSPSSTAPRRPASLVFSGRHPPTTAETVVRCGSLTHSAERRPGR